MQLLCALIADGTHFNLIILYLMYVYRVAAINPEHFQTFTVALKIIF
jgi:hypothetical protein